MSSEDIPNQYCISPNRKAKYEKNLKFVIREEVFIQIKEHLSENKHVELGGFLLGEIDKKIMITKYHPAKLLISTPSSMHFTTDTWLEFDEALETKYRNLEVLGWVHSHPDLGVFLSNMDENVNALFPYLAIVVDLIRNKIGFFDLRIGPPRKKCSVLVETQVVEMKSESIIDVFGFENYYYVPII